MRPAERFLTGTEGIRAVELSIKTPVGLSVLLYEEDDERARFLQRLLRDSGYGVPARVTTLHEMIGTIKVTEPDVVVVSYPAPDETLFAMVRALRDESPRPIVLFSEDGRSQTMRAAVAAGVNSYVLLGVNGNRVRSSIDLAFAHFAETSELRGELAKATTALAERKLIERAKGILMKQKACDEDEAYTFMRKTAMNRDIRLVQLAKMIIEAHELVNGA